MLTAAEEVELVEQAQSGIISARDRMITENIPLVKYHAKRYLHVGHSLAIEDLIQEGCIGMLQAIQHYDPQKGRFGTYASLWITQAIRFAIYSNWGPFKVPIWTRKYLPKYRIIRRKLLVESSSEPTLLQISRAMGISPKKVAAIAQAELTLDHWAIEEKSDLFEEMLVGGHSSQAICILIALEDTEQCQQKLSCIPDREAMVLRMRYGLDGQGTRSLAKIGKVMGLTKERIRQIERMAMSMLRREIEAQDDTLEVSQELREAIANTVKNRRWMDAFVRDRVRFQKSLHLISEKYALVLRLRYRKRPVSFAEIAEQIGFTLSATLQLEQQGIDQVRELDRTGSFDKNWRRAG